MALRREAFSETDIKSQIYGQKSHFTLNVKTVFPPYSACK